MVSDFDKSLVEKYIPVNKQKRALKKLEKLSNSIFNW